MKRSKYYFLVIFFVVILFSNQVYSQCSMCRAVLQSEENITVAKAINHGIVYLMVIPYVLVGLVGFRIIKALKKNSI